MREQRTRTIDYQLYCQNQFKKLTQDTHRHRVTPKNSTGIIVVHLLGISLPIEGAHGLFPLSALGE